MSLVVMAKFQSHHDLILTKKSKEGSNWAEEFQSHHDLILTKRCIRYERNNGNISIPPWSDSNNDREYQVFAFGFISIPPWSDSNHKTTMVVCMDGIISIPPWSDSNAYEFTVNNTEGQNISIPPWSDSNWWIVVNDRGGWYEFQSHHDLILTSVLSVLYYAFKKFQSHHDLILTNS